ncbi:YadA-like family protein, partial [Escherichia coli]|nr:YadA-like family protein [Escherichia coli]
MLLVEYKNKLALAVCQYCDSVVWEGFTRSKQRYCAPHVTDELCSQGAFYCKNRAAVSRNRQAGERNSRAIAFQARTLQAHERRMNSQQRQINENHEEMKRAAAQSAALAGLFQPYSVGKFNATAAVGGYSDKQAVAVGMGYRFNE